MNSYWHSGKRNTLVNLGWCQGTNSLLWKPKPFAFPVWSGEVSLPTWIPTNKWRRNGRIEDHHFESSSDIKALGNHPQDPPTSQKTDKQANSHLLMEGHMAPVSLVKKPFLTLNRSRDLTTGQEMQGTEQHEKHYVLVSVSFEGNPNQYLRDRVRILAPCQAPSTWLPLPSQGSTQVTTQVTALDTLPSCDHRKAAYSLGASVPLFLT